MLTKGHPFGIIVKRSRETGKNHTRTKTRWKKFVEIDANRTLKIKQRKRKEPVITLREKSKDGIPQRIGKE